MLFKYFNEHLFFYKGWKLICRLFLDFYTFFFLYLVELAQNFKNKGSNKWHPSLVLGFNSNISNIFQLILVVVFWTFFMMSKKYPMILIQLEIFIVLVEFY